MRRRPAVLILVVTGALTLPSLMAAAGAMQTHKKVLLIGVDGIRPDVLAAVSTPNIDALAAAGAFSGVARTRPNTVSGPGWSSMLIGVWMDKHGVTDNTFEGKRYDLYPDFLTRIEQLRPELNTLAVLDWPPLGTPIDNGPLVSDLVDVKINLRGDTLGYDEADARSSRVAAWWLEHGDIDAAFVYLGDPDEISHNTDSIDEPYRNAIAAADRQVGELIAALQRRPAFAQEDWLILMSTDHGRTAEGGHGETSEEELTIFYLASGPSTSASDLLPEPWIVDVAVTALAHLGFDIDPMWELDGRVNGIRR